MATIRGYQLEGDSEVTFDVSDGILANDPGEATRLVREAFEQEHPGEGCDSFELVEKAPRKRRKKSDS